MFIERLFRKRPRIEVKNYFGGIASEWDSISREFYGPGIRDRILEHVRPEPGKIIADLGAGTGFISEGLRDSPASIIAIDISKEMLQEMQSKFQGARNIDYRVGEANHLPVKNGIVDYVLANMYLHHVEDPPRAIREIYRIINPGGRLVLTDLDSHEYRFLQEEQHDIWLGFRHSDIRDWLRAAGFNNVRVGSIQE